MYRRAFHLYTQTHFHNIVPVLVYQMGKVGSTSVLNALKQSGLRLVYRLHLLNLNNMHLLYPQMIDAANPVVLAEKKVYAPITRQLQNYILARKGTIKVITPIRDPVTRNVSMYFENLSDFHFPNIMDLTDIPVDLLLEKFFREVRHNLPLVWFDLEMRDVLGVDVYQYPFPKEEGFLRIQENNIDILLLKSELTDEIKVKVIAEYLEINSFQLKCVNRAQDKTAINNIYPLFLSAFEKKSSHYRDTMMNSRYYQHFYG